MCALQDGTAADYPQGTKLHANLLHGGGVYSKNYLGGSIFQALAAETTMTANIIFNTPRACITLNDNFGGGDRLEGNLLFNCNRESADSGNVYTYNRLPFLTTVRNGTPSLVPAERLIRANLLMLNYGGNWALNHDDGSAWYHNDRNVILYSGAKHSTFRFGAHSKRHTNNLFAFPDANDRALFVEQHRCSVNGGYREDWAENTCALLHGATPYTDGCPWKHELSTNVRRFNNTYFVPEPRHFRVTCRRSQWKGMAAVQQKGQELGSTVRQLPHISELVYMARKMLGLNLDLWNGRIEEDARA